VTSPTPHEFCPEWAAVTDAKASASAGWDVARMLAGLTTIMIGIVALVVWKTHAWTPAVYFPMAAGALLGLWTATTAFILTPRMRHLQRLVRCSECPSRVCPYAPGVFDAPS
jgi:hypothetical protein